MGYSVSNPHKRANLDTTSATHLQQGYKLHCTHALDQKISRTMQDTSNTATVPDKAANPAQHPATPCLHPEMEHATSGRGEPCRVLQVFAILEHLYGRANMAAHI